MSGVGAGAGAADAAERVFGVMRNFESDLNQGITDDGIDAGLLARCNGLIVDQLVARAARGRRGAHDNRRFGVPVSHSSQRHTAEARRKENAHWARNDVCEDENERSLRLREITNVLSENENDRSCEEP